MAGGGAGLGKGRDGEVGREREGPRPKLLLNQGPSEPCYATERGAEFVRGRPTLPPARRTTVPGLLMDVLYRVFFLKVQPMQKTFGGVY